jgi:hypothetical protein
MFEITDPTVFQDLDDGTQASYGLWYGEQLRRALDCGSVSVDLERCPVVRLTCGDPELEGDEPNARFEVVALSASEWLECGGGRFMHGGAMWREDADRLALWLGVKQRLTEEEQQRVRAGDEWRNRWHQLWTANSVETVEHSMDAIKAAAREAAAEGVFDIRYPHVPRYRYQPPPMYWYADPPGSASDDEPDIDQAQRQLHVDCGDRWTEYQQRLTFRLLNTQSNEQSEQEGKQHEEVRMDE